MAQFSCRVALPSGEIVERKFTAPDEAALRRDLEDKDYLLLDLRRRNPVLQMLGEILRLRPRISSREFLFFNQEMSALVRSGLPILASLDILLERRKNPVFRRALQDVRERVKSGEALSDAFAAQEGLFPKLYCASLASGERSGELPTVLARYITYSRNVLAIRRKVVATARVPQGHRGVGRPPHQKPPAANFPLNRPPPAGTPGSFAARHVIASPPGAVYIQHFFNVSAPTNGRPGP